MMEVETVNDGEIAGADVPHTLSLCRHFLGTSFLTTTLKQESLSLQTEVPRKSYTCVKDVRRLTTIL